MWDKTMQDQGKKPRETPLRLIQQEEPKMHHLLQERITVRRLVSIREQVSSTRIKTSRRVELSLSQGARQPNQVQHPLPSNRLLR